MATKRASSTEANEVIKFIEKARRYYLFVSTSCMFVPTSVMFVPTSCIFVCIFVYLYQPRGEPLPNDSVIRMARLFKDEFTLANIPRPQLVSM